MATKKPGKKTALRKPAAKKAPRRMAASAATATRKLTFIGTVKSESADSIHLFLNGSEVPLKVDGDTATGKLQLDVGNSVTVKFRVGGLNGTDWIVEVDVDCADGPVKILTQKGTVGKPGGLGFEKSAKIKNDPCVQN